MRNKFLKYFIYGSLLVPLPILAGSGSAGSGAPQTPEQLAGKISNVVGFLQNLLLALSAIFIVVAAYKYLTAEGDPENVKEAKKMLLYTVIAVVIALLATGVSSIIESVLGINP